jgi:hypothetical protein
VYLEKGVQTDTISNLSITVADDPAIELLADALAAIEDGIEIPYADYATNDAKAAAATTAAQAVIDALEPANNTVVTVTYVVNHFEAKLVNGAQPAEIVSPYILTVGDPLPTLEEAIEIDASVDISAGQLTGVTAAKNSDSAMEASDLKDLFTAPAGYTIGLFQSDGTTAVANDGVVATGQVLKLTRTAGNTVVDTATVVVKGDVNGDGLIQIGDITLAARAASGNTTLTGARLAAADLTGDGNVRVGDIIQLVNMFRA